MALYDGMQPMPLVDVIGLNARGETVSVCMTDFGRSTIDSARCSFQSQKTLNERIVYLEALSVYYKDKHHFNAMIWQADDVKPLADLQRSAEARYSEIIQGLRDNRAIS